jgi:SAM-dependent methyltransferase
MGFDVAADAYDQFMGRYSALLSPQLADLAGVEGGDRVLDVGCGPGALTGELVRRVGAESVAAVDPSEPFVAAARARNPGVDVHHAQADDLPFADGRFDATLAQLVVHFMRDPAAGLDEMRRVTARGGTVAACVWDFAGSRSPLSVFWDAALELDPTAGDERGYAGARQGHLVELFQAAGLSDVEASELRVARRHESFEEWWAPFEGGVGPAGAHLAKLDDEGRSRVRERCREQLPQAPFTLECVAWAARGTA